LTAKLVLCVTITLTLSSLKTVSLHLASIAPRSLSGTIEPATASSQADLTAIDPANAIHRELTGGQKHAFRIGLAEGQYASVANFI
jgi:hypothetical protein